MGEKMEDAVSRLIVFSCTSPALNSLWNSIILMELGSESWFVS